MLFPANDSQFKVSIVKAVKDTGDYWELSLKDGFMFSIKKVEGVTPIAGSVLRTYWKGLGYTVRGVFVDGVKVSYVTVAEEEDAHRREVAASRQKKREEYEAHRSEVEARIAAYPEAFRNRIDGFSRRNLEFMWEQAPYEMFCIDEAMKIAKRFSTKEAIVEFAERPYQVQKKDLPEMSDEHSGNTFATSCLLATCYVEDADAVPKMHGALCQLVGCDDYGCWRTEKAGRPEDTIETT